MKDDGIAWGYMICRLCVRHVGSLIIGTRSPIHLFPKPVAFKVVQFVLARGDAQ